MLAFVVLNLAISHAGPPKRVTVAPEPKEPSSLNAPAPAVPMDVVEADERELQELINAQKKMADQYDSMNQFNPLSNTKLGEPGTVALPKKLQWMNSLMQNKGVMERAGRLTALVEQKSFRDDLASIAQNPNLKWMLGAFGAVFVFYFLLKRRVLAATDRWWLRIVLRLCMVAIFYLSIFLVAYGFLGQPLVHVLMAVRTLL